MHVSLLLSINVSLLVVPLPSSKLVTYPKPRSAGLPEFEIRVKLGYVLIGITWLATQLCILLGCQPFQASWQIYPEPSNFCQPAISKLNLYTTVVLNITTDIYLMSIPVPMLWKANLVTWRKFSLLIVFCGGVFVMLCGVMRCYIVLNVSENRPEYDGEKRRDLSSD